MATTLLQMAQQVVDELGLPAITALVGSNTTTNRQILALANRTGDELYQAHQWVQLQNLTVINIGTPITTTGDIVNTSTTISNIPDTTGIVANYFAVTGVEIPTAARVVEVIDLHTVRMDEPAPGTFIQTPIIFAKDTFSVAPDFKWFLDRTMWDRTNHWELIGPISPQIDEWQRSGIVTVGPRKRWRQVGLAPTNWRIWPPPTANGDYPGTLVFEYASDYWVADALGTPKASFTADSDTSIVDAQGIVLGIKWRLWQAKGFEYGAMQAEYNDYITRLAARDGGSADLTLGRRSPAEDYLLTPWNAPDSFPGNVN